MCILLVVVVRLGVVLVSVLFRLNSIVFSGLGNWCIVMFWLDGVLLLGS